jgi:hypothetical protein
VVVPYSNLHSVTEPPPLGLIVAVSVPEVVVGSATGAYSTLGDGGAGLKMSTLSLTGR